MSTGVDYFLHISTFLYEVPHEKGERPGEVRRPEGAPRRFASRSRESGPSCSRYAEPVAVGENFRRDVPPGIVRWIRIGGCRRATSHVLPAGIGSDHCLMASAWASPGSGAFRAITVHACVVSAVDLLRPAAHAGSTAAAGKNRFRPDQRIAPAVGMVPHRRTGSRPGRRYIATAAAVGSLNRAVQCFPGRSLMYSSASSASSRFRSTACSPANAANRASSSGSAFPSADSTTAS